jgi:periplasmic protein TonB
MRSFVLSPFLCILSFVSTLAQTNIRPNEIMKIVGSDTIYVTVPQLHGIEKMIYIEQMPQPGIGETLDSFFRKHMRYPEDAKQNKIQGNVVLMYLIKPDGKIDSLKVLKGLSPQLDAEAIRLIKLLPSWKPGTTNGKEVDVWMATKIPFKL